MSITNRSAILCLGLIFALSIGVQTATAAWTEFHAPWRIKSKALVIDAYELNSIDWKVMLKDKRIVGMINKASDGLSPKYCTSSPCKYKWHKYSVTKELYHTRRAIAKMNGLKWGAYHLGRPGNPIQQAQHFLQFAKPEKDDLIALDIENNNPKKWMSLKDAERFSVYIKNRTGRYPVLYTNGNTAKYIATNYKDYPILSRLNLWYARYKPDITHTFPMGRWDSYTIWQFAYGRNCSKTRCPYRVKGTPRNIDVNVVNMTPKQLRKKWPFAKPLRLREIPEPQDELLVAKAPDDQTTKKTKTEIALADKLKTIKPPTGVAKVTESPEVALKKPAITASISAAGKKRQVRIEVEAKSVLKSGSKPSKEQVVVSLKKPSAKELASKTKLVEIPEIETPVAKSTDTVSGIVTEKPVLIAVALPLPKPIIASRAKPELEDDNSISFPPTTKVTPTPRPGTTFNPVVKLEVPASSGPEKTLLDRVAWPARIRAAIVKAQKDLRDRKAVSAVPDMLITGAVKRMMLSR